MSLVKCGLLDPWCPVGRGVITEHVVYTVLGDCFKCNTYDNFNAPYDLISKKYGIINVKSGTLYKRNYGAYTWSFNIKEHQYIPDYYICVGFDENYNNIIKVWIIPGKSYVVGKYSISITKSENGLKRVKQYEIDAAQYDYIYQTFDILDLPEFRNLDLLQYESFLRTLPF